MPVSRSAFFVLFLSVVSIGVAQETRPEGRGRGAPPRTETRPDTRPEGRGERAQVGDRSEREEAFHKQRMAQIDALEAKAKETGDAGAAAKFEKMREQENERHAKTVERINGAKGRGGDEGPAGGKDKGDAPKREKGDTPKREKGEKREKPEKREKGEKGEKP